MKNVIITLWVLGIIVIAVAAALNPWANNSSRFPVSKADNTYYHFMIFLAVTGIGSLVAGGALFFFDVWETIR